MGRRKRQAAQPAISRRAFLRAAGIGAAAAAAGVGIYVAIPRSFDLSFLDTQIAFNPVIACSEPETLEPDETLKQDLAGRIKADPRIKQEWWSRAQAQPVNLHFHKVTKTRSYVPEQNAQWAKSYLAYCVEAMGDAWKKCGFSRDTVIPRIFGTERPQIESAGVVNTICDMYTVDVTLSAQGVLPLRTTYGMARTEHTRGGFSTQVTYNTKTKKIALAKSSPLFLTTVGTKNESLFTPFAEAVHVLIAPATRKGVEAIYDAVPSSLDEQTKQWFNIDEAVAHGVGHVLFGDFAKRHKLPVGANDNEHGVQLERRFPRYVSVPLTWEYARKTGTDLVKRYLDNPFEVRKKIESGNVSW